MSQKAFEFNEISFALEILSRMMITRQGIRLFKENPGFWAMIKKKLSVASSQQIKEKLIQLVELAVCSQKIDLKARNLRPHFVEKNFHQFLYFIFFDELKENFDYGNRFILTN